MKEVLAMGAYGSPEFYPNNNNNVQQNMIYCEKCGHKHLKKLNMCPQCGKKRSRPFYNQWWFWLMVFFLLYNLMCLIFASNYNA